MITQNRLSVVRTSSTLLSATFKQKLITLEDMVQENDATERRSFNFSPCNFDIYKIVQYVAPVSPFVSKSFIYLPSFMQYAAANASNQFINPPDASPSQNLQSYMKTPKAKSLEPSAPNKICLPAYLPTNAVLMTEPYTRHQIIHPLTLAASAEQVCS